MTTVRSLTRHSLALPLLCALLSVVVLAGGNPAQAQSWATCVEAIAKTQHELKQILPKTAQPHSQPQSVAAQDSAEPTPGSLAAAGLEPTASGPEGALNEAQNMQAAGNEAGCMQQVAKARSLAGLK